MNVHQFGLVNKTNNGDVSEKECVDKFLSTTTPTIDQDITEIATFIIANNKSKSDVNLATERVITQAEITNRWHRIFNFIVKICTLNIVKNFLKPLEDNDFQQRSDDLHRAVVTQRESQEAENLKSDNEKLIRYFDIVVNKNDNELLSWINGEKGVFKDLINSNYFDSSGWNIGLYQLKNYSLFNIYLEKGSNEKIKDKIRPHVEELKNYYDRMKEGGLSREEYNEVRRAIESIQSTNLKTYVDIIKEELAGQ